MSAATKISGNAATCIKILNGLTFDQLRWIFTSYDESELVQHEWDSSSVPFSDNDNSTHLWSELNPSCAEEEIRIAITDNESSNLLFKELIFVGVDETFASNRKDASVNTTTNEDLVQFILDSENAITFFGLAFVIANINQELLSLVPVNIGDEKSIKASAASLEDGIYPMSRRLYMNLHDDEASLQSTRGLLEFGFSEAGDAATKSVGLWPIDQWEKLLMSTRVQSASGIPLSEIEAYCGPGGGAISIAGSSTVFPVAQVWAEIYSIGCPGTVFTVEGGGSSVGAGRVCGNPALGPPVDIGDMSRQWKDSEADVKEGYLYHCKDPGETTRSAIQIDVAIDGLTVAVKELGPAWDCIQILGGLSIDQLRWIYSDYTDSQLENSGWDPKSLKNSDSNSQTHLWNELDERCPRFEIRIAGADDQSGTYEYFLESVLTDHANGETFDLNRPGFGYKNSAVDEELVAYIEEFAESISYFGYSYYFANKDLLSAVAISNSDGNQVLPDSETIGNGLYSPLARRIFMNLYNERDSLQHTAPFVEFGLANAKLVEATGYVAIPISDVDAMSDRLRQVSQLEGATSHGCSLMRLLIAGAIVGITLCVL